MGRYISDEALGNLKNYSYKGVDKSILSKYGLSPYWTWLVTLWPTWVAPNTITLCGLCMVLINFATMIYYDPLYLTEKGGSQGPPNWVYGTWAAGLFIYQSFDAIDGKQARRTGMAGPLGEMFDHGCDALNTTLEVILAAHALNLGRTWWTVASQIATLANFYLTTWEEYHTGVLYLGVFSGPVEGILMIVGIYAITAIYGPSFWDTGILTFTGLNRFPLITQYIPDKGLNEAFMAIGGIGLAFNIITSYMNVRWSRRQAGASRFMPLFRLLPFAISAGLQVAWLSAPTPLASSLINSPLFMPFLCAWGLQFAHQVGRMILAHVTQGAFPFWDWVWVWSVITAIDAHAQNLFGRPPIMSGTAARQTVVIWLTLLISLFHYIRFCSLVIGDITNHLGIACFTVRKKDVNGTWKEAAVVDAKKKQ